MLTGCICMSRLDNKSVWTSSQPLTPEFSGLQSSNDRLYIRHGDFVMAHSYIHTYALKQAVTSEEQPSPSLVQ